MPDFTIPTIALRHIAQAGGMSRGYRFDLTGTKRISEIEAPMIDVLVSDGLLSVDIEQTAEDAAEGLATLTPDGQQTLAEDDVIRAVEQALREYPAIDLPEIMAAVDVYFESGAS